MSSRRWTFNLVVFLSAACSTPPEPVHPSAQRDPLVAPLPSSSVPESPDRLASASPSASASAPRATRTEIESEPSTCLAPWSGVARDPKLGPKPIDPKKFSELTPLAVDPVELSFARGRVFFEARHWVEAAHELRSLAFDHPDKTVGIYSAMLYLECLNALATQAGRPECIDDIGREARRISSLYCTGHRKANEEECRTLDRVRQQVLDLPKH